MAIRRIMKHLDKAFVQEEETLPKFVDGILGNIESWLKAESEELNTNSIKSTPSEKITRIRKASLLLASLAKTCDYVGLVKINEEGNAYLLREYKNGQGAGSNQALPGMPPFRLGSWYQLPSMQSVRLLPQLAAFENPKLCMQFVDEKHAFVLHSSLPASRKSALLAEITKHIAKIR